MYLPELDPLGGGAFSELSYHQSPFLQVKLSILKEALKGTYDAYFPSNASSVWYGYQTTN
jgi:hypothetical protein